jgi:CCR4-NOT transcription complex subunit 2
MGAAGVAAGANDRYSLLGLLHVIRMTEQDLTMLALGTDLTGLGLNLNSPDSLYKLLVSPLAEVPVRHEPEYTVPACYKHTPPRLQPGYLSKFKEETLFYIFYSMPQVGMGEEATRGWLKGARAAV